jgi:thiamine biosynthesis lipoprotein ApbE
MTSRNRTVALIALFAATSCVAAQTPDSGLYTQQYENVLGTSLDMKLRAPGPEAADRAEAAVLAEIDRENAILSAWQPTS